MAKVSAAERLGTQRRLEEEMERLKRATGMGQELGVRWVPDGSDGLEGEVKGGVIYIYVVEPDTAIEVLYHEFFDYLVSLAVKPYERAAALYRGMVNAVIEQLGKEAYEEKERVVEALRKAYLGKRLSVTPSS
jgi:hypothetical protein